MAENKLQELSQVTHDRLAQLREMFGEMIEAGRMRTNFALEHFVAGQHDLPGRQRAQILAELQSLYFALADVWDEIQLAEVEKDEIIFSARDEGKTVTPLTPRQNIALGKAERKILSNSIYLYQRWQEVDFLLKLLQRLPKYTAEELEAEEPAYWSMRLARQAFMAQRDPGGNLDAIVQMLTSPGLPKPKMPLGPGDFALGLGIDAKQIAQGLVNAKLLTIEQADEFVSKSTDNAPKQINPPPRPPARKRRR